MALHLRPATVEDVPLILRFICQLADYEKLSDQVIATEASLRESLFGSRPAAEVTLAFVDNAPAGFALYFQNYSTFLGKPGFYLEDLFVDPQYRGRGAGKALLLYVAQTARERGYGRVDWSVLDWNQPAIDFYRSLGARPLDQWTTFRLTGTALDTAGETK